MKNLLKKIISVNAALIAAGLSLGQLASASDFDLSSVSATDLRAAEYKAAPVAKPRKEVQAGDDLVGLDVSIRVPFKAILKAVTDMTATDKTVAVIDPAAPLLVRSGEFLILKNLRLDVGGIMMEPVVTLKPYLEATDKLAIRIQKVQLHASMAPTPGAGGTAERVGLPGTDDGAEFSQEQMMSDVADVITKSLLASLDEVIAKENRPYKAKDVLSFKYDKAAWTLRAAVSAKFLQYYLPANLVGDIHLTGFGFNDSAIALKFATAE
jgi:hypothetical protein